MQEITEIQEQSSKQAREIAKDQLNQSDLIPRIYNRRKNVIRNQISVHLFYVDVLQQFMSQVNDKQKSGQKIRFRSSEDIFRFHEAVRYYYNQTTINYIESLKRLSNSQICEHVEQPSLMINEQKEFMKQENMESLQVELSQLIMPPSLHFSDSSQLYQYSVPSQSTSSRHSHSQGFTIDKGIESECRSLSIHQPITKNESDMDYSDSDTSEQPNYSSKAERQVNCIFFGNYKESGLKRKTKQQKLCVELFNLFVKFSDSGRDAFFDRASLELKKVEKSQVPLQK